MLRMSWQPRIRKAREAAGLTQAQLAEAVGVATSTLGSWEQAGKNEPPLSKILLIAEKTRFHPCWLAFGIGEERSGMDGSGSSASAVNMSRDLLGHIIVRVEQLLARTKEPMDPVKKAKMILALCDIAETMPDSLALSQEIEGLVNRATR